jgi:hypothetical protein
MSVIIKLLSKFDNSGIRAAQKGFSGLTKTVGALGIGLGLKQLTDGLLDAAKAASADQKSMQLLNSQLSKNTKATSAQIKNNDNFIQALSNQVGIVDDELRPAQARLARATGSVEKSQKLLKLSLDASVVSGKPLATVSQAMARAFTGNTGALTKLFPELKKSKDLFGDLEKTVGGAAEAQASPFDKLNVAMDNLKEKLGVIILPLITDFIDQMMKPGGAIDQVGKFLDDVSNPKTEAGKTFLDIKKAVGETIQGVKDFFALFGNGDAMKGFAKIATSLVKALPALLALKGIMMLASAGNSIANLAKAIGLMTGANAVGGNSPIAALGKNKLLNVAIKSAIPLAVTFATLDLIDKGFSNPAQRELLATQAKSKFPAYNPGMNKGLFVSKSGRDSSGNLVVNNITINNTKADPKATVDLLKKYVRQNGSLPFTFPNGSSRR